MKPQVPRPTRLDMTSVLVVDPFPLMQKMLENLLLASRDAGSVSCVDNLGAALARCRNKSVDIVITDVNLASHGDGIRLCRKLKTLPDAPAVLMLSSSNDPAVVAECVAAGADSFIHRTADLDLVVTAVRTVVHTQPIWFLGTSAVENPRYENHQFDSVVNSLTSREREILSLMLMRFSNGEIADKLNLARQTVKNYVSGVLQKLDVASRAELFASPFGSRYVEVMHRMVAASSVETPSNYLTCATHAGRAG